MRNGATAVIATTLVSVVIDGNKDNDSNDNDRVGPVVVQCC